MEETARRLLYSESQNWLNRGRVKLLEQLVRRHVAGDCEVLELGAGAGQNLEVLERIGPVDAVEVSPIASRLLEEDGRLRQLYVEPIPALVVPTRYDVICAMDVLEHIESDSSAMCWVHEHLQPGGWFIGTVPAYQWMYSEHDAANHHYRRYSRRRFMDAVPPGFELVNIGYFNTVLFPLAVAGRALWSFKRRLRKAPGTPDKQSSSVPMAVDRLFYVLLATESWLIGRGLRPPFGLSLFFVLRRA